MRLPACLRVLAVLSVLASPAWAGDPPSPRFPVPSPSGKPLVAKDDQKTFRVPMAFRVVEQFYRDRFGQEADVKLTVTRPQGPRTIKLVSKRKGDAWSEAEVREGQLETVIELKPVLRLGEEKVTGTGKPMVEIVIPRSREADRLVNEEINHLKR